jgi:UDP-N-acetylglucosamine/UDP-N-acetylgalactosamine diphosphorylase
MTSQSNDQETKNFFDRYGYFGLSRDRVMFFTQGMWPALGADGKIVLDRKDHLFMSPDGHGGILSALRMNGMLDDMEKRGLKILFYFQVDNPLIEIADPVFVGLHQKCGAQMSVKVCAKRDPEEGLGVVVERGARNAIVEYTELTSEQKHAVLSNGQLKFRFGSVAIHIFSLDFLKKEAAAALPLHVAFKKVPYCDDRGNIIKPDKPNAYKFEKFIFDALPDAETVLNYEFAREDEFSPVKNATGADSPDMARRDMIRKYARWLESCGVVVPRNTDGEPLYKIEIDPCFAMNADDLKKNLKKGFKITGDLLLA